RASRFDCEASRSRLLRERPIRLACESRRQTGRGRLDRRVCPASRLESLIGFRVDEALVETLISVDAAVAKKRAVATRIFDWRGAHFADQNVFAVVRGFRDHYAKRIAEKRVAPELYSRRALG